MQEFLFFIMNRKVCVFFLSLLLAVVTGSCRRDAKVAVTENEAEILFDTLSHDFGLVPKDSSVSYQFVFHNIGATPLRLTEVTSSCGCTLVDYPRGSVDPGEQASITAVYDSHDSQKGYFQKSIRVRSNAKTSFLRLSISGTVVE